MARIERLPQSVVDRIAAGEVIQRPVNVVKELLENALDAGATQITVAVKEGGLKSIHVQDNGCGISKSDMSLVCERFTTSKLRDFDDLKSIGTHGFRGEALASVSCAGNLTVTSKLMGSPCAYKAMYSNGSPLSPPRACAGNLGTIMLVEDLFNSMALRRSAMRSAMEEFNKIITIMKRYAIHNVKVAFLLKKHGEATPIVRTPMNSIPQSNISFVYGHALGEELIQLDSYTDSALGWSLKGGFLSSTNYQGKKYEFIVFINDRLVDCAALKKAAKTTFSAVLPTDTQPFCYLSLNIQPHQLDVNVHPTKKEVHFLYEDEIIEKVRQLVEAKLLSCVQDHYQSQSEQSASATQNLQKKSQPTTQNVQKRPAAAQIAPTESNQKTIQNPKLFVVGSGAQCCQGTEVKAAQSSMSSNQSQTPQQSQKPTPLDIAQELSEILKLDRSCPLWHELGLPSVTELQKQITLGSCPALRELIKNHEFIGCFDPRLAAFQTGNSLYMIDIEKLSEELFYQTVVFRLGNMPFTDLEPPPSVERLLEVHLKCSIGKSTEHSTWCRDCVTFLEAKAKFLLNYFSLEIKNGQLIAYPTVFEEFDPQLEGLPQLLWDLANNVNWHSEKDTFNNIARYLAQFMSFKASFCEAKDDKDAPWREAVKNVIFPQAKIRLLPPKHLWEDNGVFKVTDSDALGKVFGGC